MCLQCNRATTGKGGCGNNASYSVIIDDNGQVLTKVNLCDLCFIWALDNGLITGYVEIDR